MFLSFVCNREHYQQKCALFFMQGFEKKYADILSGLIRYGKLQRKLMNELTNELLDIVDYEPFIKIYNRAADFPNEDSENWSLQLACFIGYIRGCNETLDTISQHLKYSLLEYPDDGSVSDEA